MTGPGPGLARPGRPRNAALDDIVLDVAIDLFSVHGFHDVSMDDIAAAAHTGKDTLYRRWPSKHDLVTAALDRLVRRPVGPGPVGSEPGGAGAVGLAAYISELDRLMTSTALGHIVASAVGEADHDPEIAGWLAAFWAARRSEAAGIIGAAAAATQGVPDALADGSAADVLLGALCYRWFIAREPLTRADIERLARAAATQVPAAVR